MRIIDADAIITFVSAGHLRNPMEKTWSDNDVVDMIESRPTVDSVPVVRCGECKHRGFHRAFNCRGDVMTDFPENSKCPMRAAL